MPPASRKRTPARSTATRTRTGIDRLVDEGAQMGHGRDVDLTDEGDDREAVVDPDDAGQLLGREGLGREAWRQT